MLKKMCLECLIKSMSVVMVHETEDENVSDTKYNDVNIRSLNKANYMMLISDLFLKFHPGTVLCMLIK